MADSNRIRRILAAIGCILLALFMFALGGLMVALESPPQSALAAAAIGILPATVALALLVPATRTPVIRGWGVLLTLVFAAVLVNHVLVLTGLIEPGPTRVKLKWLPILALLMAISAWMAWRGKWPPELASNEEGAAAIKPGGDDAVA